MGGKNRLQKRNGDGGTEDVQNVTTQLLSARIGEKSGSFSLKAPKMEGLEDYFNRVRLNRDVQQAPPQQAPPQQTPPQQAPPLKHY